MKSTLIRVLCYGGGLLIVSFGITITILAGLGTGAWDALNVGLAIKTPFSVGNWVIFVGIILIILNALITRARPIVVSLLTIILLGYFIDFWLIVVFQHTLFSGLVLQLMMLLLGIVILAFGASIYLQAEFALLPIDGFMFAIKDLLGVKLMIAKTIAELIALVAAFLFGGPIGLGTIIVTFLLGPLIQWFFPRIGKKLNWKTAQ
ncbi:YczE/YyaS/YitT family protein [Halalkalibacter lacteus]|uniref:YczE/YyaS/YitT family protein n=1 Tax=Halalkalibacter lacteus TaxID=3090663 RepID=UPI002FC702B4